MREPTILGMFWQGQGYLQFAADVDGFIFEGCRQLGSRKTIWTATADKYAGPPEDKVRFGGVPDKGTAKAIVKAFDAYATQKLAPKAKT